MSHKMVLSSEAFVTYFTLKAFHRAMNFDMRV